MHYYTLEVKNEKKEIVISKKNNQYHRYVESAIFRDGNVAGRMNFELFTSTSTEEEREYANHFSINQFLYIKLVDDANQRSTLLTRDQHWKVEA